MRTRSKGPLIEPFDLEIEATSRQRTAMKKKLNLNMADLNLLNQDVVVEEMKREFTTLTAHLTTMEQQITGTA